MKLDPECFKDNNLFFLKASGHLWPCCYVSSNPEGRAFLGKDLVNQLNVNEYSFDEITNSEAWAKLKETMLSDQPLRTCMSFCVIRDKRPDQDQNNSLKNVV
jgi:hypothetical protein